MDITRRMMICGMSMVSHGQLCSMRFNDIIETSLLMRFIHASDLHIDSPLARP